MLKIHDVKLKFLIIPNCVQGHIWNADCPSYNTGLLHLAGTLKQKALRRLGYNLVTTHFEWEVFGFL